MGAAVAIRVDGRPVVDLWAGHADLAKSRPWERDTIVNVYSTTKGLAALCAHRLVDRGRLDLDAPVADYWPEFAAAGKADLPVRYLLDHRAGLAAFRAPMPDDAFYRWDVCTEALAAQEPWWKPGERHGYHMLTFGWLVGEVVRRVSGKSCGTYFRDEIAAPLGADAHIGLDPSEFGRVAEMSPMAPPDVEGGGVDFERITVEEPESVTAAAGANPPTVFLPGVANTTQWRRAEIPAANAHTNARALARIYGAVSRGGEVDGHRVLAPESIARCHTEQSSGYDEVLRVDTRFAQGFMLGMPHASLGPNPHSFGHPGAGGSLGFADPDARVGFGYTMNLMEPAILVGDRAARLVDAVYGCV